jgi:FAD synthetase
MDDGNPDPGDRRAQPPTTVIAQGTFDLLHPGHIHYLEDAASMGDRLVVIIARSANVDHKEQPICPATQRRDVVAALDAVDEAILGDEADIFRPIERIEPDVIALGHDQHHDDDAIQAELDRRGIDCVVRRASPREPRSDAEILSTRRIIDRVLDERG